MDIYADDRGVFVLESLLNDPFAMAPSFEDGLSVQFNDGTGWVSWHDIPAEPGTAGADRLAGIPSGALFLWSGGCPLERLNGPDDAECQFADQEVVAAAPVGSDELYMVTFTGADYTLVHDASGTTTTLATLSPSSSVADLWADATEVIVLLSDGVHHATPTAMLEALPGLPSGDELTAIAANSAADLWVGTFGADLFHWDGTAWSDAVDTSLAEGIVALWLDGDVLYFAGAGGFGSRNGDGTVEVIFEVPLEYRGAIMAMSGNNDRGEVYLALLDADFVEYACGPAMLIVYDGETLRRF